MDVLGVAEVDRDGHAGLREFQRLHHRLADAGPAFAGRGVVRKLHPSERNFVLPQGAPARDELGELLVVESGVAGVAFALIPEHAAQGVGDEVDHLAVEEASWSALEFAHRQRIAGRRGYEGGAVGLGFGDGGFPGSHLLLEEFGRLLFIEGEVVLHLSVEVGFRLRIGGLRLGGDPGFDGRAADGSVDQADGDADFLMDLATKEIEDGGEATDVVGRASAPCTFAFGGRGGGVGRGFLVMTDQRVVRSGLLGVEVIRGLDGHRHVRLARAEPDFAHEYVFYFELMSFLAGHDECPRFGGGLEGIELEHPLAVGIRGGGLGLASEGDGHGLARIGPTPDGHGLLALENHVVGDRRGQAEAGGKEGRATDQDGQQDGKEARGAHAYLTSEIRLGCENRAEQKG